MIDRLGYDTQEGVLADIIETVNKLVDGYNELHKKLDPLVAIIADDRTVTWRYDPTLVPDSDEK